VARRTRLHGGTVHRTAWYRYLNPLAPLYDTYAYRNLLSQFVRREIEGRYRGSNLGVLWSVANPLFTLATYTFVFSAIFKARWRPEGEVAPGEFAITLFAGLIAFNIFAESVNRAPSLVVGNVNYVKRVVFPLQILPVSALAAALFHALISIAILVVGDVLVLGTVPRGIPLALLAANPLVTFTLGLSWLLASLGVYVRDTAYAVGIATQLLFFFTPVLYRIDIVPEPFRTMMRFNPLSYVVEDFRRTLVWNESLDWTAWGTVTLASAIVFSLGYAWFMKTRPGFADVI
jgi:lipopolysaccharide transport system permease protein